MKSERAKKKIGEITRFISIDWVSTVEKAVELAEQDARERAVKVFCESSCPREECPGGKGYTCERLQNFLKAYDNE